MSTVASNQSGIPIAVWNIIFAIGFIGACIGGVIGGVQVWNSMHRWGLIAVAICFGLVGVLGLIRQWRFSATGEGKRIIFLVNFDFSSLPWTIPALVLAIGGIVLFFISPPF